MGGGDDLCYSVVAVKPLSAGRERAWALESDRPGVEFCVSH